MIKKYEKAFYKMYKKAKKEFHTAESQNIFDFFEKWSKKYPHYPYGDEIKGVECFINFVKENFKDKK